MPLSRVLQGERWFSGVVEGLVVSTVRLIMGIAFYRWAPHHWPRLPAPDHDRAGAGNSGSNQ